MIGSVVTRIARCILSSRFLSAGAVIVCAWWFAGDYFAPGGCLDFGGSFNYRNWECIEDGSDSPDYLPHAIYGRPSFIALICSVVFAVGSRVWCRTRSRPQSTT
jgi:hypothetical protein